MRFMVGWCITPLMAEPENPLPQQFVSVGQQLRVDLQGWPHLLPHNLSPNPATLLSNPANWNTKSDSWSKISKLVISPVKLGQLFIRREHETGYTRYMYCANIPPSAQLPSLLSCWHHTRHHWLFHVLSSICWEDTLFGKLIYNSDPHKKWQSPLPTAKTLTKLTNTGATVGRQFKAVLTATLKGAIDVNTAAVTAQRWICRTLVHIWWKEQFRN